MASAGAAGSIRLDKLLWYLRLARSRSLAQAMIATGHLRLDGRRVTRASCAAHVGQILVLPLGERIAVLRLVALPVRRGPPAEAQSCYQRLDGSTATAGIQAIDDDCDATRGAVGAARAQ